VVQLKVLYDASHKQKLIIISIITVIIILNIFFVKWESELKLYSEGSVSNLKIFFGKSQKFLLFFAPPCKILGYYINEAATHFFHILQNLSLVSVPNIQFHTL